MTKNGFHQSLIRILLLWSIMGIYWLMKAFRSKNDPILKEMVDVASNINEDMESAL